MNHEFQSTLYPTSRAMCDAIAYEWMTAGGANNPASIDAMTQSAQHHAEECIEGWNLLAQTESGNDWLADRDSSAAEVLEAFERFLHTRPDRAGSAA
jgi:hypothetical protein